MEYDEDDTIELKVIKQETQKMQQIPPRQQKEYWTPKHVWGIMIVLGSIGFGMVFTFAGLFTILPLCALPFLFITGVIGLVMLF